MQGRWRSWMLLVVALVLAVLIVRSCGSGGARDAAVATVNDESVATPGTPSASTPASEADTAATAAARERVRQRDEAMYAAAGTVQRYLAALGGDDRAKADGFWVNGRPPSASGEADLRALTGLRGLRIENGTPTALDGEAVPTALQVPVTLRASVAEGTHRYTGWYRVRRRVTGDAWEITSASVTREPAVQ